MRIVAIAWALVGCLSLPGRAAAQEEATVEAGVRLYAENGDARSALRVLEEALGAEPLAEADALRGWLYMSFARFALGDERAAEQAAQRALALEPCVVPSAEFAPPPLASYYRRHRPRVAACEWNGVRAAGVSAVVPGLGALVLGRKADAAVHAGGVLVTASLTVAFARTANARWQAYREALEPAAAERLHADATGYRRLAIGAGLATAALHTWGIARAWRAGSAQEARVRPFVEYAAREAPAWGLGVRLATGSR